MSGPFDFFKKKNRQAPPRGATSSGVDLYAILDVSPDASQEEIRAAYRRMAAKYHPDRNPGNQDVYVRFLDITKAHEILGDEAKRAAYDAARAAHAPKEEKKYYPSTYIDTETERETSPEQASEKRTREKTVPPWDLMFDPSPQRQSPIYTTFKQSPPPRERLEMPWDELFPKKVSVSMPDKETLISSVKKLPLKDIWTFVRNHRNDPAFHDVGMLVVGPLAGVDGDIEQDIADITGTSFDEIASYSDQKGDARAWHDVLAPLAEGAVLGIESLKPKDIPGHFYLDWDPTGAMLELLYMEPRA